VHALGGGAQSALWCQILADALDREVEQVPDAMVAQLRGAALFASVTLGVRTIEQISSDRQRGVTFEPRAEHRELFAERRALFPKLFRRERHRPHA
jgi:xylulokinase